MIQIKLIPEGDSKLPVEAEDHGVLADNLKGADPPDHSPAPSWRDIRRVVHKEYLYLEIDGSLDDYADGALDGFATAIANINGMKKHPDGWVEIEDEEEPS